MSFCTLVHNKGGAEHSLVPLRLGEHEYTKENHAIFQHGSLWHPQKLKVWLHNDNPSCFLNYYSLSILEMRVNYNVTLIYARAPFLENKT